MPLLIDEQQASGRLRRMKLTATAFLVLAAALYAVAVWRDLAWLRAGSEAAMVGGLADWFAVTALFKHPLGLPIPHTGIVPRKKDELATKLGEFVTGHFLTREVVIEQLRSADVLTRVGTLLSDPEVAQRLAKELAFNAGVLLEALDEDLVVEAALELLRRDQARRSYAPVLGRMLDRAIAGGTQRPLVDVLLSRSKAYLRAHREELLPQARQFVDDRGWLASLLVSDKRIRGVLDGLADTLEEVERDPRHPVRGWLEGLLRTFAHELQHDAQTAAKLQLLIAQLLEDPQAQAVIREVVTDAMVSVRASLSEGGLQQRVGAMVTSVGRRTLTDQVFRERVQQVLEALVGHIVETYGDELTLLIRRQVARWDGRDASRRIELAVGRDLQFIRINGTAVGALAGLAIHAVTVVVS